MILVGSHVDPPGQETDSRGLTKVARISPSLPRVNYSQTHQFGRRDDQGPETAG